MLPLDPQFSFKNQQAADELRIVRAWGLTSAGTLGCTNAQCNICERARESYLLLLLATA